MDAPRRLLFGSHTREGQVAAGGSSPPITSRARPREAVAAACVAAAIAIVMLLVSPAQGAPPTATIGQNYGAVTEWSYMGSGISNTTAPACTSVCMTLVQSGQAPARTSVQYSRFVRVARQARMLGQAAGLRTAVSALPGGGVFTMGVGSFMVGWSIGSGIREAFEGAEVPAKPPGPVFFSQAIAREYGETMMSKGCSPGSGDPAGTAWISIQHKAPVLAWYVGSADYFPSGQPTPPPDGVQMLTSSSCGHVVENGMVYQRTGGTLVSYYVPMELASLPGQDPQVTPWWRSWRVPADPGQATATQRIKHQLEDETDRYPDLACWLDRVLQVPTSAAPWADTILRPLPGEVWSEYARRMRLCGFTDVRRITKPWQEADVTKPADAVLDVTPEPGTEVALATRIEVLTNPGPDKMPTRAELELATALEERNSNVDETNSADIARECLRREEAAGRDGEDECRNLPIFVSGDDVRSATDHDIEALTPPAGKPGWVHLNYRPAADNPSPRGWYEGVPPCVAPRPADMSCDEFPFYATAQGGGDATPVPSLKYISQSDNTSQGAKYSGFLATCEVAPGNAFLVVPIPAGVPIPTLAVCNRTG